MRGDRGLAGLTALALGLALGLGCGAPHRSSRVEPPQPIVQQRPIADAQPGGLVDRSLLLIFEREYLPFASPHGHYRVQVKRDGSMRFQGLDRVISLGRWDRILADETVDRLDEWLEEASILDGRCIATPDRRWGSQRAEVLAPGHSHEIRRGLGRGGETCPFDLRWLEAAIDDSLALRELVGTAAQRREFGWGPGGPGMKSHRMCRSVTAERHSLVVSLRSIGPRPYHLMVFKDGRVASSTDSQRPTPLHVTAMTVLELRDLAQRMPDHPEGSLPPDEFGNPGFVVTRCEDRELHGSWGRAWDDELGDRRLHYDRLERSVFGT